MERLSPRLKHTALAFKGKFTFDIRKAIRDDDRLPMFSHSLDQGCHIWLGDPHDPFCIPRHVEFD